jgi:hypothetical protein
MFYDKCSKYQIYFIAIRGGGLTKGLVICIIVGIMDEKILNIIDSFQKTLGITDVEFVGKDASLLSHIRGKRKKLNKEFLCRLGNLYPGLLPAIKDYLFPSGEVANTPPVQSQRKFRIGVKS